MDIGHLVALAGIFVTGAVAVHSKLAELAAKRAEAAERAKTKALEVEVQRRDLAHREANGIWEDATEWRAEQGRRIEAQAQIITDQGRTIAALQARVLALEGRDREKEIEIERLRAQGCSLAPDCAQREPANGKGRRKPSVAVVPPVTA